MSQESEIAIPESCHEILSDNTEGTLSTLRKKDGLISSNPVGFVWDGQRVRISTLKSRVKYRNLIANPLVTLCVVSHRDLMQYVEIRGHASIEEDPNGSFFREQYRRGTGGLEPPEGIDPPDAERVTITIHPRQVSSPSLYAGRLDQK
ncbi:MAG: pyridoxamine 5'-phosphate oxidase family protein [Deltaproteobacteria bacterium]|nr:pyridoxamine 5'-phosphate oxidase family protein [Deltaproteobacteria bacterium]MBW2362264.1 pyridoxamine 5'-phosphate oxidase family protein [Deltaproteobacteria bacterium]